MTEPLPSKLIGETITVSFNFTDVMLWGEVITSAVVTVEVFSGLDYSPENLLSGSTSFVGRTVIQKTHQGLPGVVYILVATIETADHTYIKTRKLAVLSDEGGFGPGGSLTLTGTLPGGTVGVTYSNPLQISGGYPPYHVDGVASGTAPFWMNFSISDDELVCAGTPDESAAGTPVTYIFAPQIADAANTNAHSDQEVDVVRMVLSGNVPDGDTGEGSTGTYSQVNGTEPVVYSVISGTFPDGLTLASDGSWSGTHTGAGVFSWVVQGVDANGVVSVLPDTCTVQLWRWWFVTSNSANVYVTDDPINGPWQMATRNGAFADPMGQIDSIGAGRLIISSTDASSTKVFVCTDMDISGGVLAGTVVNSVGVNFQWTFDEVNQVLVGREMGSSEFYTVSTDLGTSFTQYNLPGSGWICWNFVQLDSGRWLATGGPTGFTAMYNDSVIPIPGDWELATWDPGFQASGLVMRTATQGVLLGGDHSYNSNNGSHWEEVGVTLSSSVGFLGRCALSYGNLLIHTTGSNGNYWISRNGGSSWNNISFGQTPNFVPFSTFKHGGITVFNGAGKILYSIDDENTWQVLTLPESGARVCLTPLPG